MGLLGHPSKFAVWSQAASAGMSAALHYRRPDRDPTGAGVGCDAGRPTYLPRGVRAGRPHRNHRALARPRRLPQSSAAAGGDGGARRARGNPSVRISDIRDLVGMSTKRFIALFRAEVGLSPKAYARAFADFRRQAAAARHGDARRSTRGRCRLFRPGPLRPGIPVFHRHDADAVCRTTDSVAQPRPRRGAGAAQISKTAGRGSLMMGRWTTPNTR